MNIRDTIDRVRHTRISKPDDSEHEKKSHDEMAKKYEEKKKFHNAHNQNRPQEESAKEKVLKSVFSHGKKLAVKARQKAQEEALRQGKKQKKSKKPSTGTRRTVDPRPEPFNFGFGNSDIPLDEMFDFRNKSDHSKLFKKKKSDSLNDVWNPKDFWQ